MSFQSTYRIFAFPLSELQRISELVALYGDELPDRPKDPRSQRTRCLCGGLDREGSDDLRSLSHPTTASTTPLTDGRHAYGAYWTDAIATAVDNGDVTAEEITSEQLESLRIIFDLH